MRATRQQPARPIKRKDRLQATEIAMASVYVLAFLVLLLVIYLFYAVINPQKF